MIGHGNVHIALIPPDKIETGTVEEVAGILNKDIYQVRYLLSGWLPRLIASYRSVEEAGAQAKSLQITGLSVFVCESSILQRPPPNIFKVNSLSTNDGNVEFTDQNGSLRKVTPDDVFLILKCNRQTYAEVETTSTTRKLSIGKTLLTGIPMFNKVKQTVTTRSFDTESVLRLYNQSSPDPIVDLCQHSMDYKFLGPRLNYSSLVNFSTTVNEIRNTFSGAYFDDRLTRAKNTGDGNTGNDFELNCRLLYLYYNTGRRDST